MNMPVMIISGASRGLGEATARLAAKMGAVVVLNARSQGSLNKVAQQIQMDGGASQAIAGDVSKIEDCQHIVSETISKFGRLDALVNNAGTLGPIVRFAEADPLAWERTIAINLFGAVNLTRAALPYLRTSNGRIVHVSTGAALEPYHGFSAYGISKAALNHFNRALALEEPQVTSVAVRPGKVDTEMQTYLRREGAKGMASEQYQNHLRLHAQGELLPPEKPGLSIVLLALNAPHSWSGEFIQWDDPRIQSLI